MALMIHYTILYIIIFSIVSNFLKLSNHEKLTGSVMLIRGIYN